MALAQREKRSSGQPVTSTALRLGGAAAGLALLGALVGLGAAAGGPAAARPPVTALALTVRVLVYLVLALAVVVGAVLVYALWPQSRRGKRNPDEEWEEYHEPPRLHWVIKLTLLATPLALLFGAVAVAVRLGNGNGSAVPGGPPLPPPGGLPATTPLGPGPGGTDTGLLALAIAAGIVALAVAAALLLLRRSTGPFLRPADPGRAVAAAVDDGLEALHRERDPRRAVVLAYAAMERALARRGWPRAEAEAPFEYLARLSSGARVAPSHLHGLTELFEVARFSEHEVNEPMRTAAVSHLESVRADLAARPSTA